MQRLTEIIPAHLIEQISPSDWQKKIRDIVQTERQSTKDPKFQFLEVLRPLDLFGSYQFTGRMIRYLNGERQADPDGGQLYVLAIRPCQLVVSTHKDRLTVRTVLLSQIVQFGQSLGNPSFFFVRLFLEEELLIFQIQETYFADYILGCYQNWKLALQREKSD